MLHKCKKICLNLYDQFGLTTQSETIQISAGEFFVVLQHPSPGKHFKLDKHMSTPDLFVYTRDSHDSKESTKFLEESIIKLYFKKYTYREAIKIVRQESCYPNLNIT